MDEFQFTMLYLVRRVGLNFGLRVAGHALGVRIVGFAVASLDVGAFVGLAFSDMTKYAAVTGPQYPAETCVCT